MAEETLASTAGSPAGNAASATSEASRWVRIGLAFQMPMMGFFVVPLMLFGYKHAPGYSLLDVPGWAGAAIFAWCLWRLYFQRARTTGLITSGVFRYTRNPMYLGLLLMNVSHWARLDVWTTPLFLVLEGLFLLTIVLAGYCQERETLARFGQQAVDYYRRTPRIPFTPW